MDGILIIDKEKGMTSRDVVNAICKQFDTKKVGHTGTLDPIATGVLVLCVNESTKLVEIATAHEKEYIVEAILGIETSTIDTTSEITNTKETKISELIIKETLNKYKKKYLQEVPIYSAVKVNGKKLYEYAREGKDVELPKKEVEIKEIELLSHKIENSTTTITFKTRVSKGTYIRALIKDIATDLETYGTMNNLRRTKVGKFDISDSKKLEDITISDLKQDDILLSDYEEKIIQEPLLKKVKCGQIIENEENLEYILFKDENNEKVALYKKYEKDITKLKPFKMFQINK